MPTERQGDYVRTQFTDYAEFRLLTRKPESGNKGHVGLAAVRVRGDLLKWPITANAEYGAGIDQSGLQSLPMIRRLPVLGSVS